MSSSSSDIDHLDESTDFPASKKRRLWTKQEDEKLRLLVSYWGDQSGRQSNWDKIAAQFENRNAKNCRKRWFHSLDPKLRRGKWSPNEDKVLLEAYEQLGPSWQRIAQLIPGRTDDQCSKRYTDVLDPAVQDRLRPWTKEEDDKLLELYNKHGRKWQAIAAGIDGRTGLVCRNRWRKLTRPPREINKASSASDVTNDPVQSTTEMNEVGYNNFEVPGGTFPAGADANWFQNSNSIPVQVQAPGLSNMQYPLNSVSGQPVLPKHISITIEGPETTHFDVLNSGMHRHHSLTQEQLTQLLNFASEKGKQIVVHQHIYQQQAPSMSKTQQPLQLTPPQAQPLQLQQQMSQRQSMPQQQQPIPPMPMLTGHSLFPPTPSSTAPPLQHNKFVQPPPDEFLSRPLLYEDPPPPEILTMPYEDDFLAFNPS